MVSTIPTRTKSESTLGQRGAELASGPSIRDQASTILGDNAMFNPETNLEGLVNIGTAENYIMFDEIASFIKSHDVNFLLYQIMSRNTDSEALTSLDSKAWTLTMVKDLGVALDSGKPWQNI